MDRCQHKRFGKGKRSNMERRKNRRISCCRSRILFINRCRKKACCYTEVQVVCGADRNGKEQQKENRNEIKNC